MVLIIASIALLGMSVLGAGQPGTSLRRVVTSVISIAGLAISVMMYLVNASLAITPCAQPVPDLTSPSAVPALTSITPQRPQDAYRAMPNVQNAQVLQPTTANSAIQITSCTRPRSALHHAQIVRSLEIQPRICARIALPVVRLANPYLSAQPAKQVIR